MSQLAESLEKGDPELEPRVTQHRVDFQIQTLNYMPSNNNKHVPVRSCVRFDSKFETRYNTKRPTREISSWAREEY